MQSLRAKNYVNERCALTNMVTFLCCYTTTYADNYARFFIFLEGNEERLEGAFDGGGGTDLVGPRGCTTCRGAPEMARGKVYGGSI